MLRDGLAGLPWRRVDVVEETGSTNADLLARSAAGENIAGHVLFAEYQSQGRGRHGRQWSAPARSQLSVSVGVDASEVTPQVFGHIQRTVCLLDHHIQWRVLKLAAGDAYADREFDRR